MKLTIDAKELSAVLRTCVAKRGTMPITEFALLDADGQSLSITTTDLTVSVTETIKCEALHSGRVCAEVAKLKGCLSGLRGDVALELSEAQSALILSQQRRRYRIPIVAAQDFPEPLDDATAPLEITPDDLATGLDLVGYTADETNARAFSRGVFVGGGAVAASDGLRLAWMDCHTGDREAVIVPKSAIAQVVRASQQESAHIIAIGERALKVTGKTLSVTTLLVDTRAPSWRMIVEQFSPDATLVTASADLLAALDRIRPFSGITDKVSAVELLPESKELRIASGAEDADAFEVIELESISGQCDGIKCGLSMLADAIRVIDTPTVQIELGRIGGKTPALRLGTPNSDTATHMITGMIR